MDDNPSFDDLMGRLRAGDNDAATRVFNEYANRLIALARRRLDPRILQKVDPEDVLQSVFRSFFRGQAAGRMDEIHTWDSLWGMLVVITRRKCGRRAMYFHADRRDVQREVSPRPRPDQSVADWEAGDEPTPEDAAILAETVERLMLRLDEKNRHILALRLQGCPAPEIAAQARCTERTVYRVLDRVKTMLHEMHEEGKSD
jgi:RNA polymerase sigma-70 factor (ECF subfamily)